MQLYKKGALAFKAILSEIENANSSIKINMFIWRDDEIGSTLARAVLAAADRGVKVVISLDRVGNIFERAEESQRSLFHESTDLLEKIQIFALQLGYKNTAGKSQTGHEELAHALLSHPNVKISKDVKKHDHSKFYVFDDRVLIFGGVNIEDKENGKDSRGIEYQDYMVKIEGEKYVSAFFKKREEKIDEDLDVKFLVNMKKPVRYFEIEQNYVSLIENAKSSITIVMAYFSYVKPFISPLLSAVERGVDVKIMVSKSANFQDASNKKSLRTLLKKSGGKITAYFSPEMLHTKLLIADDAVCFGSCNFAKQSFKVLDELNLLTSDDALHKEVRESVNEELSKAEKVTDYKRIKYSKFYAFFESIFA